MRPMYAIHQDVYYFQFHSEDNFDLTVIEDGVEISDLQPNTTYSYWASIDNDGACGLGCGDWGYGWGRENESHNKGTFHDEF